jgi:eukaryotic-like serine/threonine-protein kinase
MNTQSWERVKDLLHEVMQLAPEERVQFLDQNCSSDEALRAEVESLLLAEEVVRSSFLQSPMSAGELGVANNNAQIDSLVALEAGKVFAQRFLLVRKLGEGGMGQVWLADQTSPVRRQVALKLVKAGMYDEAVVQRFLAERQSLAIMDHPAIAKVFDAGTTLLGQPYFVMEFVPGLPITEYCDRKKLKISDRLELFIQACEGVQHAHQKAIIHRDLKPANILVVEVDGKPVPRIIDFGLAKAARPYVEGDILFTEIGHFVGTPGYMSPEQADSNIQDIDTRTDVYSLGVVLYMLLCGSQPFETRQKQPLDELLRKLREEDPPTPSSKVSSDRNTSAAAAEARGTEPRQLVSLLRGDLDWITMKALEKDRTRRYGAPSELAADIRRYLHHEPVLARPANPGYRLRKYTRRHRVVVSIAAGLVLLLAGVSVLQTLQLRRITRERDRANRERDRATRITDFMTDMFKLSDPNQARGNSVTAREILDKASNDIDKGLAHDPEELSQMKQVMAATYENLGLYSRAHDLAQRLLDARLRLLGPDHPKTLESMLQLSSILDDESHYTEAEKLATQASATAQRVLGPGAPLTIDAMDQLGTVLDDENRFDESEKLERQVIAWRIRNQGLDDMRTLKSVNHLGILMFDANRYPEAEDEFRQALDGDLRVLGSDHPQTMRAMANLASTYQIEGRLSDAEPLYRQLLAADQRVLGREHHDSVLDMENLATLLLAENHLAESAKLYRTALEIFARTEGAEHGETLRIKINLAKALCYEGHLSVAEGMLRQALSSAVRVSGPESPLTLLSQGELALVLNREGRYAEAEPLARKTVDGYQRAQGAQYPDWLEALTQLGIALARTHHYPEAGKLFHEAIENGGPSGMQGNPWSAWYAFSAVETAADRQNDAFQYLHEAINRGYKDADALMADDDFKTLHQNPHFQQLVAQLRQAATYRVH